MNSDIVNQLLKGVRLLENSRKVIKLPMKKYTRNLIKDQRRLLIKRNLWINIETEGTLFNGRMCVRGKCHVTKIPLIFRLQWSMILHGEPWWTLYITLYGILWAFKCSTMSLSPALTFLSSGVNRFGEIRVVFTFYSVSLNELLVTLFILICISHTPSEHW